MKKELKEKFCTVMILLEKLSAHVADLEGAILLDLLLDEIRKIRKEVK